MKTFKKITSQSVYEKCIGMTCDICAKHSEEEKWPLPENRHAEIKIEMENIYSCHDFGDSKIIHVDLCPHCFESKLLPLLSRKPRETEIDW